MTAIDLMKGTISTGNIPAGQYTGRFKTIEHLPMKEADPMTGKGGREWEQARFIWEIAEGEYAGKQATTETSLSNHPSGRRYKVMGWLLGQNPTSNYDLSQCVGKKYLLTLGSKPNKQWIEVTNAMLIPNQ